MTAPDMTPADAARRIGATYQTGMFDEETKGWWRWGDHWISDVFFKPEDVEWSDLTYPLMAYARQRWIVTMRVARDAVSVTLFPYDTGTVVARGGIIPEKTLAHAIREAQG